MIAEGVSLARMYAFGRARRALSLTMHVRRGLLAVEAVTEKTTIVYGDEIPNMIGGVTSDPAVPQKQQQQSQQH